MSGFIKLLFILMAIVILGGAGYFVWIRETVSPSVSIVSLSPSEGPPGTKIIITGSYFSPERNTIYFGSHIIPDISSSDGKTLQFTAPLLITEPSQTVSVADTNKKISNTLTFILRENTQAQNGPDIRDARRIADIKQIQLGLEIHFNQYRKYPRALSELVGGALPILAQDPSGVSQRGMCRPDYCYAYSPNKNAYHLGAQLEQLNNPMLPGKDCDSLKGVGCPASPYVEGFDGSVPGIYDVNK